jgi:hypothetical protein
MEVCFLPIKLEHLNLMGICAFDNALSAAE